VTTSPFSPARRPWLGLAAGLCIVFAVPPATAADGQLTPPTSRFRNLGVDDGLSHPSVYGVLRDRQGFMWIGTQDGADRWDSQQLVRMGRTLGGERLVPRDDVSAMWLDADGTVWIGSWGGGLTRYQPLTGAYRTFRNHPADADSLADDRIQSILRDRRGRLWVGTHSGLDLLTTEAQDHARFQHFRHRAGDSTTLARDRIWALAEEPDAGLWLATEAGLDRFDPATGAVTAHFGHDPADPRSLPSDGVRTVYRDRQGRLWVGTEGGLAVQRPGRSGFEVFRPQSDRPAGRPEGLSGASVNVVLEDRQGAIWVGTQRGGLDHVDARADDPAAWRFTPYRHRADDPHSLANDDVRALYEDDDLLWVGTRGNGLSILDLAPPRFEVIGNDSVLAVARTRDGSLWLGTDAGLVRQWPGGAETRYTHVEGDRDSLVHDTVASLLVDRQGNLWVGSFGGLDRVAGDRVAAAGAPESRLRFDHVNLLPGGADALDTNTRADLRVRALLEDHRGRLWVGTSNAGLFALDPSDGERLPGTRDHLRRLARTDDPAGLADDSILTLVEDTQGAIWIGTDVGGLDRLDPETRRFVHFRNHPQQPTSLSDDRVNAVYVDPDQTVWAGTSAGLNRLDPATGLCRRFDERDGLPSAVVQTIAGDPAGPLWLATHRGLALLSPTNGKVTSFDEIDGLPSRLFNAGAVLAEDDGHLVFGSRSGAVRLHRDNVEPEVHAVRIALTGFEIGGQPAALGHPPETATEIGLAAAERNFAFAFAALEFRRPGRDRFDYRLEGLDPAWTATDRPFARYTNVPPGEYRFRVRLADGPGTTGDGLTVIVRVAPYWWETDLARGAGALLLIGLILGVWRWRLAAVRRRTTELERLVAERTAQLANRERESGRQRDQLALISGIVRLINEEVELPDLLRSVLEGVSFVVGAERGMALVAGSDDPRPSCLATVGWPAGQPSLPPLTAADVPRLLAEPVGEPVPGVLVSPGPAGALAAATELAGLATFPLFALRVDLSGASLGLLIFASRHPLAAAELATLHELAGHVASAVAKGRILAQLKRVNAQKDEFLGVAAHDLRSPLGSIQSYADLLLRLLAEGRVEPALWQRFLGHIRNTSRQMLALVADLLDVAAIETGRLELNLNVVPVHEIFDTTDDIHSPRAREKNIAFTVRAPPAGLLVRADRDRIAEVLDNLVANALKYTAVGGGVVVTAEPADDLVWIRVRDTGQGLEPSELAAVFSGRRLSPRPTGGETSTGFGLVIVRRLVELHGGQLTATSVQGEGSTFSFSLPAVGA
jgi:ligand-binding sensor domain-containing protein/signal transduction histidine kinase